jgi:hypothetical protein
MNASAYAWKSWSQWMRLKPLLPEAKGASVTQESMRELAEQVKQCGRA